MAGEDTAGEDTTGEDTAGTGENAPVNLVVVADVDFASQQFFDIRRMGAGGLRFDNVTFFLNLMDVLVEDESFIALRSKRVRYRTLETVERQTLAYTEPAAGSRSAWTRSASGPTWTIRPGGSWSATWRKWRTGGSRRCRPISRLKRKPGSRKARK